MSNSQQLFREGQAHGEGESRASQLMESAKETANSAYEKITGHGGSMQENREHAAELLQQTGEQVTHMAREAANTVKDAVGMGGSTETGAATTTTTTRTEH